MTTKVIVKGIELSKDDGAEYLRNLDQMSQEENVAFAETILKERAEGEKRQLAAIQKLSDASGLTIVEVHDLIGKKYKEA